MTRPQPGQAGRDDHLRAGVAQQVDQAQDRRDRSLRSLSGEQAGATFQCPGEVRALPGPGHLHDHRAVQRRITPGDQTHDDPDGSSNASGLITSVTGHQETGTSAASGALRRPDLVAAGGQGIILADYRPCRVDGCLHLVAIHYASTLMHDRIPRLY